MKHDHKAFTDHHTAELNYNKLTPLLQQTSEKCLTSDEVKVLIEEAKTFEKVNNDDTEIIGLFNLKDFTISYLSKNASLKFDCPVKEGKLFNEKALFYVLDKSHTEFPQRAFEWMQSFTNNFSAKAATLENSVNYFCGVKLLSKNGEIRSYFIRQHIRTYSQSGRPCTCVCFLTDITHLFKADFYWSRMVRGKHKEITAFKVSDSNKENKDIITPREKQILQLISSKKESKEISKILNISLNTVDSHRKKMIKRSGAKDTTALIQLCKMARLI